MAKRVRIKDLNSAPYQRVGVRGLSQAVKARKNERNNQIGLGQVFNTTG